MTHDRLPVGIAISLSEIGVSGRLVLHSSTGLTLPLTTNPPTNSLGHPRAGLDGDETELGGIWDTGKSVINLGKSRAETIPISQQLQRVGYAQSYANLTLTMANPLILCRKSGPRDIPRPPTVC